MQVKKYIFGLVLFTLLLAGTYFLAIHQLASGYVDKYYPKFTEEAGSLVVGLSRAQYGIVPSVVTTSFPNADQPMINFAFEIYQSAYGEVLLEDIKNKLKSNVHNGVFILEVSPGSFLIPWVLPEEDIDRIDSETILGKMESVGENPNYEYIRKCYGSSLYKGFFRMKPFGNITVHDNGWVAFASKYDFYTVTEEMSAKWKQETLETYGKLVKDQRRSDSRIQSFVETIRLLKQHGHVHLVRMPAAQEIITFENTYWEGFDQEIEALAAQENVGFLNYTLSATDYQFYDGSHLFDKSAVAFTKQLCEDIKKSEQ